MVQNNCSSLNFIRLKTAFHHRKKLLPRTSFYAAPVKIVLRPEGAFGVWQLAAAFGNSL